MPHGTNMFKMLNTIKHEVKNVIAVCI